MSAKWLGHDVMDNGLTYFGVAATAVHVIDGYVFGESYAAVVARSVGAISVSTGDFSIDTVVNDRRLTMATKTIPAASNDSSGDLHVAVVDAGTSEVLGVWEETSDQVITTGNPIQIPPIVAVFNQPT